MTEASRATPNILDQALTAPEAEQLWGLSVGTGGLLSVVATLGFVAAGLALFDVVVPFDWWRALAIASAAVSLLLVLIFWHRYLIAGLLIDGVVLVTLIFTTWSPG